MPAAAIHTNAAGKPVRHELPDCDHEYEGKMYEVVYDYIEDIFEGDTRDSFRNQILANYVEENGLAIRKVKDYGQDAVTLPEANMEGFSSFVNNK